MFNVVVARNQRPNFREEASGISCADLIDHFGPVSSAIQGHIFQCPQVLHAELLPLFPLRCDHGAVGDGKAPVTRAHLPSPKFRRRVFQVVAEVVSQTFPEIHHSLCHVYAVVGAIVASEVLQRHYRPVAGLAVFDAGNGCSIRLLDNGAFLRERGGAFHCWVESVSDRISAHRELVDLTYGQLPTYAKESAMPWHRGQVPDFLWGRYGELVLDMPREQLPSRLPLGKLWLEETIEGRSWLTHQMREHEVEYTKMASLALRYWPNVE